MKLISKRREPHIQDFERNLRGDYVRMVFESQPYPVEILEQSIANLIVLMEDQRFVEDGHNMWIVDESLKSEFNRDSDFPPYVDLVDKTAPAIQLRVTISGDVYAPERRQGE